MPLLNEKPIHVDSGVLLWIVNVENYQEKWRYFYGILNKEEREHVHNIAKENLRKRFIIQRGFLKYILADKLNVVPEKVHILKSKTGKPYIEGSFFSFNYSHSGEFFMIGIAKQKCIGVDIQIPKQLKYSYPTMIFSKEEKSYYKSLRNKEEKEMFFWKTWTVKEAFSKATGEGMTVDFSLINVSWDDKKCCVLIQDKRKSNMVQAGSLKKTEYYYAYVLLD